MLDIEWERFNALKSFIVEFVSTGNGGSPFFNQTGTQIKENKMVLQLLQLLFHLIQGGFYPAKDLVEVLPTLIQLLDGRDDKVHEIRRRGRAVSARDDPAAPPQPRAHLRPLYSLPQEVSPKDFTELHVIQLSFDVSCLPRIASPVARHGQLSGRSKATDEHEEPRSSSLRRP